MATLLLSAAGAAVGSGIGGTVLGLSGAVIGRAAGATLGRAIDQRLLGSGSDTVETGRVDRLRLSAAGEGGAVARVWGRVRVAGQVIWATEFLETVQRSGGGKGAPRPSVNAFSYSVSLAIALCEGEILRIARVWADGAEIAVRDLNLRVYRGTEDQLPDPRIEAVEGAGRAPAYRGTAYVVIEDLDLTPFGNRVPQFSFEVVRPAQGTLPVEEAPLSDLLRAVALIPGTGEFGLATTPVNRVFGPGNAVPDNMHTVSGETDFTVSLRDLVEEAPACGAASLIISWFGDDLRAGNCAIRPRVDSTVEGDRMEWRAGGLTRATAGMVPMAEGRPVYGGTPADAAVVEAITALRTAGREVMFYPFVLMEQLAGNGRPDPWSGAADQPTLPWRGRVTLSVAPGRPGSPDRTAAAEAEVAQFFGAAQPGDFTVTGTRVDYAGPADFGYRRFILHYAHLCAAAGGVDAFCIGSELRGLTQIRGAGDSFPAVAALRALAAEVRVILGPQTKIGYAADWSEYFGYHVGNNVYFHLDPLWSDSNVDFIGIDNYMPLSDWRDGDDHADAGWGSIHAPRYLRMNIAGGEGFDWFYDSPEGEAAQRRIPIRDEAHGEEWVFRVKDLAGWWSNPHHDRIDGVRQSHPTDWVPGSKPIWFTEYGCAAIDKGTNHPNRFLDPKSSESALPRASSGNRDDLIQLQYFRAMAAHWADVAHNPTSALYGGRMVDMEHAFAWAWDTRPFPAFPALADLWSDAPNYSRGHWLNGRISTQGAGAVVREICRSAGLSDAEIDTSRLFGIVRGMPVNDTGTVRTVLQPLMLALGADPAEREGRLSFRMRGARPHAVLVPEELAMADEVGEGAERTRASAAEVPDRVRVSHISGGGNYDLRIEEAVFPSARGAVAADGELPLVLTRAEARAIAERWISEARIGRDGLRLALPPSAGTVGAGDVIEMQGTCYRIDRVETGQFLLAEAVRVEPDAYAAPPDLEDRPALVPVAPLGPVLPVFLDLPLLSGQEVPHAPHLAVTAARWGGAVTLWSAAQDAGYEVNRVIAAPAVVGTTETPLVAAAAGLWDRGPALRVRLVAGALSSATPEAVLNGANVMAIGDGSSGTWEVFQFAEAMLVAPGTYELSLRLRGQGGSDGIMPAVWPAGSTVVLLDRTVGQIDLAPSARGLEKYYRVGRSLRGPDDLDAVQRIERFDGIGLRPYPVAHLRANLNAAGLQVSWTRRTRIDGDSWQSVEVPLGEHSEAYLLRLRRAGAILHEAIVDAPVFTLSPPDLAGMGALAPFEVEVAQLSAQFGPGPFRHVSL